MAFRVSEYAGPPITAHSAIGSAPNGAGFIRAQAILSASLVSTGSAGTALTMSPGTYFIMIDSDQGALVAFGSSTASAPTMTSTLGQHIPANVAPVPVYVKPNSQLFVSST